MAEDTPTTPSNETPRPDQEWKKYLPLVTNELILNTIKADQQLAREAGRDYQQPPLDTVRDEVAKDMAAMNRAMPIIKAAFELPSAGSLKEAVNKLPRSGNTNTGFVRNILDDPDLMKKVYDLHVDALRPRIERPLTPETTKQPTRVQRLKATLNNLRGPRTPKA